MAKYKVYPEYKDSGIEWLGMVPDNWLIKKLKYLCTVQTGSKDTVNAIEEGLYPFFVRSQIIERINTIGADCEAVLTAGDGVGVGKVYHYYNGKFDFHQRVYMLNEFKSITGRFVYYYLSSNFYKVALEGNAKSTVDSLRLPQFLNFEFSVPNDEEQKSITSFLDHETAKIDNLIEKQQQLIELLKEKRQAVISHAVTKGLNPDVPMKDSGVEWLGLISGRCSLIKLKYLVFLKIVKLIDHNSQYVGMENISSGTGKLLTKYELIPEGASISFDCGDVLFGKLRPYLAKSWLATFSGVCSSEFLVFHTRVLHPKFLNYYLLANEFVKQVDSSTYGSKMPRANWDFIGQLPVPTWSYEESEAIATYLDSITFKLGNLLEKQYQQVRFLQERRTALISAAVTGKIDVRNWVAPNACEAEVSQEVAA